MCDCYPYALDLGRILYYWVFSSETDRKDTSFHLPWRPTLPQLCLHTEHSSAISHFSSSDLRVKTASVKNHTKPVPTHPSAVSVPLFGRLRKTPALHQHQPCLCYDRAGWKRRPNRFHGCQESSSSHASSPPRESRSHTLSQVSRKNIQVTFHVTLPLSLLYFLSQLR